MLKVLLPDTSVSTFTVVRRGQVEEMNECKGRTTFHTAGRSMKEVRNRLKIIENYKILYDDGEP